MSTADTMSASSGPRYAPDDPTLPKPWKGLIDGSTGAHYYWNPETNATQYERPPDALHPLPSRTPLPANAAPSLTPTSVALTSQPSVLMVQQQQQQQIGGPQLIQPVLQTQHYPALQTAQQQGTQPLQPLEQASQPQVVQQSPMVQMQQMPYQQNLAAQRQPIPYQQGQMPVQQVPPGTYPRKEDLVYQHGKPGSHSASQMENNGTHPSHVPQLSLQPHAAKEVPGYSINAPEDGSSVHVQHGQNDGGQKQQYTPPPHAAPKHTGHSMLQHPQGGSLGSSVGYDPNQRAGHDLQYKSHSAWYEGQAAAPQPPFPASVPVLHNQQEIRKPVPMQNGPYGHSFGMNVAAGHSPMTMYKQPSVRPSQTFVNNASGWHAPKVASSSDFQHLSAADAYRQQHEVTAMGDNVPAPFMTFEDTGFPPEILREINMAGFTSPTPIQAQTWPIAIQSRDIVAIAKTGSGKTLGYLIPAFIHLRRVRNNSQVGPVVLVLAPTRELATQILDEAIKFGRSSRVSCTCLYGGAPKGPQLRELERGVDIVVATPGRLNDILDMRKINFSQISFVVLDEADRMLDMGFEPQIRKIVNEIPPKRQTVMYTATWPKEVRKIAGDLLVNPVQVNIGSVDELAANDSITQYVEVISQMGKQQRLEQILRSQERESKVIIFCATKRQCDQLARILGRNFRAVAIHGDKSQGERDWVLNQFRSGKVSILVATDVAARGLDIKDIRVVINYDFPTGIEDYVHRIGRTGRAGATGVSFSFLSDQDWKYAADLVKVLEGANQQVPPEVREMAARGGQFHKDRGVMNRRDSNGGAPWESRDFSGGRGNRYGGRGGGRDNGFGGGHSGGRDIGYVGGRGGGSGFGGRGQDNGYGGRHGGRDNGFSSGRGYRNDFSGGRGGSGRGFGRPGGWGRHERQDRFRSLDGHERYESRRGGYRSRSPSPYRGRSRGYNRSSSRSRSRSRSWSRSSSRSWSRSQSRSLSRSPRRGRSRSRSNSYNRREIRTERTEPVHETTIIPQESGGNSSQRTPDVKDVLPPSVSQMIPAEDCQTLPNPTQQVNHELLTPNLDQEEKISGDT